MKLQECTFAELLEDKQTGLLVGWINSWEGSKMIVSCKFNVKHAKMLCLQGKYKQAKEELQKGCKTIPEKQVRKVGQLIGLLMDEGFKDQAAHLLNTFYKD